MLALTRSRVCYPDSQLETRCILNSLYLDSVRRTWVVSRLGKAHHMPVSSLPVNPSVLSGFFFILCYFLCSKTDVHTVASLLKLYLRELPEPVIPFCKYDEFLACTKLFSKDQDAVSVSRRAAWCLIYVTWCDRRSIGFCVAAFFSDKWHILNSMQIRCDALKCWIDRCHMRFQVSLGFPVPGIKVTAAVDFYCSTVC